MCSTSDIKQKILADWNFGLATDKKCRLRQKYGKNKLHEKSAGSLGCKNRKENDITIVSAPRSNDLLSQEPPCTMVNNTRTPVDYREEALINELKDLKHSFTQLFQAFGIRNSLTVTEKHKEPKINQKSPQNITIKRNESAITTEKKNVASKEKETATHHRIQKDDVTHKITVKDNTTYNVMQKKNVPLNITQEIVLKENIDKPQKKTYGSCDNNLMNNRFSKASNNKAKENTNNLVSIGSGETKIPSSKYNKIKWTSYSKATRSLLLAAFPRSILATHSLTGKRSPAFQNRMAKMSLDRRIVDDIIIEVTRRFNVKSNLVRNIITTKCADECKMSKLREMKLNVSKNERLNDNRDKESDSEDDKL